MGERVIALTQCGKGQLRINNALARHHAANRSRQLSRRSILEQEPDGSTLHRLAQIAAPPKGREDHNPAGWQALMQGVSRA
jgi:hypothetical protein